MTVDRRTTAWVTADCNLRGLDLAGANLAGLDRSQANLAGADLTGADLAAANLTGTDLAGVTWGTGTTCPEGTVTGSPPAPATCEGHLRS